MIKKLFEFQKRDFDWWFFTFLPIILILGLSIFMLQYWNIQKTLIVISEQLLLYSIVLTCTDLGIKFKSSREMKNQVGPSFLMIIFSLIALIKIFSNRKLL